MNDGEGWILELLCRSNNHELIITLLGHPYMGRLTNDKKIMLVDMKERNKKNVTIKQVYKTMNIYRIIEWYHKKNAACNNVVIARHISLLV